ncbi:hypothetical protein VIGAN_06061900 [Vigna angularis var. angularis]|uniref:Uncharacterized protein n=1 Tax=Vigna angularis var. angularis TaxID=157739 RepID=A0A0S3S9T9_PHAAN|nr:hypothetical protein VIGAN_06061900 [Vigna angularis var. angularis]
MKRKPALIITFQRKDLIGGEDYLMGGEDYLMGGEENLIGGTEEKLRKNLEAEENPRLVMMLVKMLEWRWFSDKAFSRGNGVQE